MKLMQGEHQVQSNNYHQQESGLKIIHLKLIIGNPEPGVLTKSATENECLLHNFLSHEKPRKVEDTLKDSDWVIAMQEKKMS